jgi:hypothetical protein
LGPTEYILSEDDKQDGVLDKNKTMDNVQKHNICPDEGLKVLSVSDPTPYKMRFG